MSEITRFDGSTIRVDRSSESDLAVSQLQKLVADRVRKARNRKGLSRRALSDSSGVSQRYLAQLEAGEGNISIGLLLRVARALDHRIEWLVGEDDPWESELLRAMELLRTADRDTRDSVLDLLKSTSRSSARSARLCLIGLRGAGKSTLGPMLAEAEDSPFLELNGVIESIGGMPVGEIIALYGQEGYRRLEVEALDQVAMTHDRVVLAAAGGVVAEPETFNKLLNCYNTIWLRASPEEHMDRVRAQGDERPMAGNPEAMEQLKQILRSREALYARAQAVLDTSGKDLQGTFAELVQLVDNRGFLKEPCSD